MNWDRIVTLAKSKTVWGAAGAALVWAAQQPAIDWHTVVQAGGVILSAIGVRDAIAKK